MKKKDYWKGFWEGWVVDKDDLGYPLPQGISVEGEWIEERIIVEKDVPVPMRDGVKLAANVFRPDKPGRFPVIASFTPYSKDLYGWGKTWGVHHHKLSEVTSFEAADPGFWVPNDYVVVLIDNRGYGNSEGKRLGYRGGEDQYDGIEWTGTQEWSNGNVGMTGVSALGACQWYAAQLRPPHLKAIVPWEATTMLPITRYGGIVEIGFYQKMPLFLPPIKPELGQSVPAEVPPTKLVFEDIIVPALICVTWSDQELHTRGTLRAYQVISSEHKWLFTHGGRKWDRYYSPEALTIQKAFFDYFLKGSDSRIMEMPRVRLEVRETIDKYTVRYENEWPITRTKYKELHLDAVNGTLNFGEVSQKGKVSYDSADGRAVFDTKFDRDTELTGHMKLKLWVSPEESDDMDLFITLKKIDVNGNEVLFDSGHAPLRYPVALGWLRLSKRQLDEKKSTPWQPIQTFAVEEKVKPGEIVPADIEIVASSTLFRKGETLRLVISGKSQVKSTRYVYEDINKGKHSIYTGGNYDSYLLVPVVPHSTGHH